MKSQRLIFIKNLIDKIIFWLKIKMKCQALINLVNFCQVVPADEI